MIFGDFFSENWKISENSDLFWLSYEFLELWRELRFSGKLTLMLGFNG